MYDADPTLLDRLELPTQINKDDFVGRLMIDIGESEVCITNPRIMKIAIGAWSRGRLAVWQRLADVMDLEYNPIWNVDGETTHTGSTSGNRSYGRNRTDGDTEIYTRDRTVTEDETVQTETSGTTGENVSSEDSGTETVTTSGTETTTGQISADNVETWSNDTKTVTDKTGSSQTTTSAERSEEKTGSSTEEGQTDRDETINEDIADSRNRTGNETISDTEQNSGQDSWTERRTGNIGVTTTQKMMTEEVEFWSSYDIIKYIINQFAHEFCLLVY